MKNILAVIVLVLSCFSNLSYAESWSWKFNVKEIRTYGGGNGNKVCFTGSNADRPLCFHVDEAGGSEKYSLLMAAKMADKKVSASYKTDSSINIWFNNYALWHLYLED